MPINHQYAGKTFYFDEKWVALKLEGVTDPVRIREIKALAEKYPHGVPFTGCGKADFSRYAEKKIEIVFSGNSTKDVVLVNKSIGFRSTPEGMTWHHHHDGKTMMLIDKHLHREIRHTGGSAIVRSQGDLR